MTCWSSDWTPSTARSESLVVTAATIDRGGDWNDRALSYIRTLLQLRTSLQVRGAFENSDDLQPSILNELINDALVESYDIGISAWEDYNTVCSPNITIVAGTDAYAVPTDFYKLRHVEIACDSTLTKWIRLRRADLSSSNLFQNATSTYKRFRYRLQGGSTPIVLMPIPQGADTFRIWYVTTPPQLAADGDTVQFDVPAEQKLVLNIAYRDCLVRQDLDSSAIDREIEKLSAQLRSASDNRDAAEPFYLSDRHAASPR